ncbi:MAG: ethanolamine ammonia-lyase subunit EutC [Lutimaribacter sp.]
MSDFTSDPWAKLRAATPARIALGRAGVAVPTQASLAFQFAHARARDAVHSALDVAALSRQLQGHQVLHVQSGAPSRAIYLRRPDLGRRLAEGQAEKLPVAPCDVLIIVADGLSAMAVQTHASGVIHALVPRLSRLRLGPVVIAQQARVAIGDEIGAKIGARLCILLVGERPGLTVADSLGAYLTFAPEPGIRDSARNCVSNIHDQGGLSHTQAAAKIAWLAQAALKLGLTGTGLKENAPQIEGPEQTPSIAP